MDILAEGVECLAGLLHNERFSFEGQHFQLHDASVGMRPVQEHVPVWVGGPGEKRVIPLAARVADGWDAPLGPTVDDFARKVGVLERVAAWVGRDPAAIRWSARIAVVGDERERDARLGRDGDAPVLGGVLFGSDDEVLDGIRAYEAAGADQILFAGTVAEGTEQLERVADLLDLGGDEPDDDPAA